MCHKIRKIDEIEVKTAKAYKLLIVISYRTLSGPFYDLIYYIDNIPSFITT